MPEVARAVILTPVACLTWIHSVIGSHVKIVDPAVAGFAGLFICLRVMDFDCRHIVDSLGAKDPKANADDFVNLSRGCCLYRSGVEHLL